MTGEINSLYGTSIRNNNFPTQSTLDGIVVFASAVIMGVQVWSNLGCLIEWSMDWAQLSGFHLKKETELSPKRVFKKITGRYFS
jgi:hypothetical protein